MPDASLLNAPKMTIPRLPGAKPLTGLPAWASLLERFYAPTGLPLPRLEPIRGEDMPQPYRSLLVHNSDMTPALETFYHQPLGLTVLSREHLDSFYLREVVLEIEDRTHPVEYGVIRICLNHFPQPARRRVLEEQYPLGNILQREGIPHISWPQNFFSVECDTHIKAMLRLPCPVVLYGRRNVLLDTDRRLLAEVIEVLAPVQANGHVSG